MGAWPVQDAKARFSELLETTLRQGPQVVTKRGVEAAVLVPIEEWRRMKSGRVRNIKEVLLGPGPRDIYVPPRGPVRRRPPIEFE